MKHQEMHNRADPDVFILILVDFRPGSPFSAFGTEVIAAEHKQTSVPEVRFRRLGRK